MSISVTISRGPRIGLIYVDVFSVLEVVSVGGCVARVFSPDQDS